MCIRDRKHVVFQIPTTAIHPFHHWSLSGFGIQNQNLALYSAAVGREVIDSFAMFSWRYSTLRQSHNIRRRGQESQPLSVMRTHPIAGKRVVLNLSLRHWFKVSGSRRGIKFIEHGPKRHWILFCWLVFIFWKVISHSHGIHYVNRYQDHDEKLFCLAVQCIPLTVDWGRFHNCGCH